MDGGGQDELKRSRDGAAPASPPSHRMGTDEGDDPPHLRRQQGCRYQPGVEVFCPRLPEEAFQRVEPGVVEPVQGAGGEAFEQDVELLRPAPAAPARPVEPHPPGHGAIRGRFTGGSNRGRAVVSRIAHHAPRSTIIFLIPAIALAGFSPFGQAVAQFMMVWQR